MNSSPIDTPGFLQTPSTRAHKSSEICVPNWINWIFSNRINWIFKTARSQLKKSNSTRTELIDSSFVHCYVGLTGCWLSFIVSLLHASLVIANSWCNWYFDSWTPDMLLWLILREDFEQWEVHGYVVFLTSVEDHGNWICEWSVDQLFTKNNRRVLCFPLKLSVSSGFMAIFI